MAATPEAVSNFDFLKSHDPLLLRLGKDAERYFSRDPNTSLLKLRQLGEALAQHAADLAGLELDERDPPSQLHLIRKLERADFVDREVAQLFHLIRKSGNRAVHEFTSQHGQAMEVLKACRKVAIWFHRTLGRKTNFKAGPFIKPTDPSEKLRKIEEELAQLRLDAESKTMRAEDAEAFAKAESMRAEENAKLAGFYEEDKREAEELAAARAEELALFRARLKKLRQETGRLSPDEISARKKLSLEAGLDIHLDEAETKLLIDQELSEAGWEAESLALRFGKGVWPERGKNKAIAEWPTDHGPADYILFVGLMPIAVVEAKAKTINSKSALPQAEGYSLAFQLKANIELPEPTGHEGGFSGWPAEPDAFGNPQSYRLPFAFSSNGREYFEENDEANGIWFNDLRKSDVEPEALKKWPSPESLSELLKKHAK